MGSSLVVEEEFTGSWWGLALIRLMLGHSAFEESMRRVYRPSGAQPDVGSKDGSSHQSWPLSLDPDWTTGPFLRRPLESWTSGRKSSPGRCWVDGVSRRPGCGWGWHWALHYQHPLAVVCTTGPRTERLPVRGV